MPAALPPAESAYVAPAPESASGDAATPNASPIEVTVQGQRPRAAPDAEVITRSSARELPG